MAMPPAPPVNCNATGCVLSKAYGVWGDRKECWVQTVVYPTNEDELRSAVAQASQKNQKVKVVSGFSHTIPKLACPPSENSTLISTAKYNAGIEVDAGNRTVTADAGVGLRALIDKVEAAGLSLVAAPYWEGVSIGGVVSTGSHGSSWWGKGGAVHDHVVGLSLVVPAGSSEGYVKVVRVVQGDLLFNAARVSLRLLGVISKVTLSLEPIFKRNITYSYKDDSQLEDEFHDLARQHEFPDITWYPSQHKAVHRYDDRATLNGSGDGMTDFIGFQSNLINVSTTVRSTAIFPASKFRDFILDVKKLRDLNPDNFCGVDIYNGFLIRFIKGSEAYLGQSEDSVVLDINYHRADEPLTPRLNQDIWEEVEQMAFFKYGAKPH
ncbi:hypothetical protein COCNU_14G003600 [Cocos nucifera]|uniref:FAD-binding PCMH-type domain-containing protein n=1 Tax=Cocos nucifera TaxID=13894 RepID=A0A8K0IUG9_COCNU|nr:hypothetical protein COCNU_14G003600 [Cocos nucifera]